MKYYGAFVRLCDGTFSKVIFLKFCESHPLFKVASYSAKQGFIVLRGVGPVFVASGLNSLYRSHGWKIVQFRSISAQLKWIAKQGK